MWYSYRSALCSAAGGSLCISVVVLTDPSGCINARFVQVNSWVPITSSRSISSFEDRAITSTPQRVTLLSSEAGLQPQLSFNLQMVALRLVLALQVRLVSCYGRLRVMLRYG